jgi:hypothetical protein
MALEGHTFKNGREYAMSFRTEKPSSTTAVTDQLERQFAAGRADRISDPLDLSRITRLWRRSGRGPRT